MKKETALIKIEKQNALGKDNEFPQPYVKLSLKEEMEKIKSDRLQRRQNQKKRPSLEFRQEISSQALNILKSAEDSTDLRDACEGISNILHRSKIHFAEANTIFYGICKKVEADETNLNDYYSLNKDYVFSKLIENAREYCQTELLKEVESRDLPSALMWIGELEQRVAEDVQVFPELELLLNAVKRIKTAVERAIDYKKKEWSLRQELSFIYIGEDTSEEKNKDFTLRVKVLLFLALSYNNLELPVGLKPTTVARSFHKITGGDFDKMRNIFAKPTDHKMEDKQSKKYLIDDLRLVQEQIVSLGLADKVVAVRNEIASLQEDLEDINNEEDFI